MATLPQPLNAVELAVRLARAKAESVAATRAGVLVIGADQVVSFRGQVFGKPEDADRARAQLAKLAGSTHELITGVATCLAGETRVEHDVARLTLRSLSDAEIERYLGTGEWQGCAGGYRIEGRGITLFSRVEGDFTGIQGLPMLLLCRMLRDRGVPLP